jgi:hypothetical protein
VLVGIHGDVVGMPLCAPVDEHGDQHGTPYRGTDDGYYPIRDTQHIGRAEFDLRGGGLEVRLQVRLRVRLQGVALRVPAYATVLYTESHATNDVQRRDEGAKKELAAQECVEKKWMCIEEVSVEPSWRIRLGASEILQTLARTMTSVRSAGARHVHVTG